MLPLFVVLEILCLIKALFAVHLGICQSTVDQ